MTTTPNAPAPGSVCGRREGMSSGVRRSCADRARRNEYDAARRLRVPFACEHKHSPHSITISNLRNSHRWVSQTDYVARAFCWVVFACLRPSLARPANTRENRSTTANIRADPQAIPGKVFCAYYDIGGEGIAYHDTDAKNNGSGGLNPADGTYLNEFRMNEGVDISYTKFHDQIDNNPYNLVQPSEGQLYVGWTEPGEWFNLTVEVERAGVYPIDFSIPQIAAAKYRST